jgi:hypothetical protein
MRFLKVLVVIAALVGLAKYFPVIYYSTVFNDMVKVEAQRAKAPTQLRGALMQQAELYFLPVKSEDIQIREQGEKFQVTVDYKVPVDLFVFTHVLTFHAAATGVVISN